MKKSKKILISIAIILVILLVAAYFVLLNLYPEQTKNWTLTAWDWLNKPLPIVGVSTLFICILIWRVFASTSFGKKQVSLFKKNAEETQHQFESLKAEYETKIRDFETIIENYRNELNKYREGGAKVCKTSPNKKIQAIGVKYYGERKETINNETTTD